MCGTSALSACYKDPTTGEVKEPGRKLFAKLRENKHKLGATPDTPAQRPPKRGAARAASMKTSAMQRVELSTDISGKAPARTQDRKVKASSEVKKDRKRHRRSERYVMQTATVHKSQNVHLKAELKEALSTIEAMGAELTALQDANSSPTDDQLIGLFEKHARNRLKDGRQYTVEGYEFVEQGCRSIK